jgi:putative molybdopterin biosynthesis protein
MKPGRTGNRVREVRETRGLSQTAFAASVALSRQSVSAIEGGRALPSVDVALRIARALDCSVESLFRSEAQDPRLSAELTAAAVSGRVALAQFASGWLAYPLDREGLRVAADGLIASSIGRRAQIDPLRSPGESNVRDVRRQLGKTQVALLTLARWQAGLVLAPGNPKQIQRVAELARRSRRPRLVAREPGSGAQRLLDAELARAGLCARELPPPQLTASGQLEVAQAVASGAADVGVATRDAAIAYGLTFLPLAEERYDLVVKLEQLQDPRLQRLLDVMTGAPFRRELACLGYDVSCCGERAAEVHAA